MKTRGICFALAVLLTAGAAQAQKVEIGYDKAADFSRFKTYSMVPRTTPPMNPAIAALIDANIEYELNQKGLTESASDPDLLVKSYGTAGDVQGGFAAEDAGHKATGGVPMSGTTMWTGSLPATPSPQVMKGAMTVDLFDARQNHLVWRATAKGKLDYNKRSKLLDQANKAITEMFRKYPPQ